MLDGPLPSPGTPIVIMNNLRLLLWNANGLLARKLELEAFLSHEKIDVALVTETHCTSRYSFCSTLEFDVLHTFHPSGKARGGAAVFVRKSLNHSPGVSFTSSHVQMCAIQLLIDGQPLTIASVYCSPSCKLTSVDFDLLFQNLSGKWIAGGDFNAKNPIWGSRILNTRGRELATVLERRNLESLSSGEPTYWPSDLRKKPDVIDFFVARHIHHHQLQITTIADLSSDHVPICATLQLQASTKSTVSSLVNRYTDWDLYRSYLESNSQHHIPIQSEVDIELAVSAFTGALQNAAHLSTPSLPPIQTSPI